MPSIDKAYVELGTDLRPFDSGMDKAERRFGRSVESMSGKAVRLALADDSQLTGLERAANGLGQEIFGVQVASARAAGSLAAMAGGAAAFSSAMAQGQGPIRAIGAGLGRTLNVAKLIAIEAVKYKVIQGGLAKLINQAEGAQKRHLATVLKLTKAVHKHTFLIKGAWAIVAMPIRAVNYLLGRTARLAAGVATGLMLALAAPLAAPLMLGAGAGLGAGLGFAIKQAGDLEAAVGAIRKTTGLEGGPLAALVDNLKEMSTTLAGVSVDDAMTIAEEAGRLGIAQQGPEAVLDYVRAVAMLRVALDDVPAEELSTGMAVLLNNFKLGTEYTQGLGSALNRLADTSNATGRDILDVAKRSSLAARQLGLTATQTLALATAAKSAGVETEVAGTAISQILGRMTSNLGEFAAMAGVSVEQFTATLRADPLDALEAVAAGIASLDAIAARSRLNELGLDGERVVMTMRALSENFGMVRQKAATADAELLSSASILQEVRIKGEQAWAQLQRLWNQVKLLAAGLGSAFLPAIKAAGDHLGAFLDRLREGAEGGLIDRLASGLERVVDVVAQAFEDPSDRAALFMAFLDVLVAATKYAAAEMEDAIVSAIGRAFGRSAERAGGFLGGLGAAIPGLDVARGTARLLGLGREQRAPDKAADARRGELEAAMRAAGGVVARMAGAARRRREGRQAGRDAAIGRGAEVAPLAAGTADGNAGAAPDADIGRRQFAFGEAIRAAIASRFTPDAIDAEMAAAREKIMASIERAAEAGLIDEDELKVVKKATGDLIDRQADLARLQRGRLDLMAAAEEDLADVAASRAELIAGEMERRAADGQVDIGSADAKGLAGQVQQLAGKRNDTGKEQVRFMKRLAELAEREQEIQEEQRDDLALIAREMAATETM